MVVATRQRVEQQVLIELRSHSAERPREAEDLRGFDVCLLRESRLFRLEGLVEQVTPEHLQVLFDAGVETPFVHSSSQLAAMPVLRWSKDDRELGYEEFRDEADESEEENGSSVDVFCHPGVTDAEGETAAGALSYAGLESSGCKVGRRFRFAGVVALQVRPRIEKVLGNPLIHSFIWSDGIDAAWEPKADTSKSRQIELNPDRDVEAIQLRGVDDEGLHDLSKWFNLALTVEEMRAVAVHFETAGRAPTDVELQSIALAWSEHCCHKTFKATIELERKGSTEAIPGLLRSYIVEPSLQLKKPWIRSAFADNAGIMAFDRDYDIAFKVETHNHPSALEPYGGAHTGVGGVIRDVLGVSAEPIANTDVLCFGRGDVADDEVPKELFHPRATLRGVVRGISDYGNNMGIPTVGGAVVFHHGYTANPLVFCGTLGLLPCGSHSTEPREGDAIVLLGGRTGRDGLHGATMSSSALDRQSVTGTAVQIGAPITEKKIRDVLPCLRDEGLYSAITDCGAGGLCSAVGEMGAHLGLDVDLERVPLKYQGLAPWEIWLSEAQERMVLSVPPSSLDRLVEICESHDVEVSELGSFRNDAKLRLWYDRKLVGELEMEFLYEGRPAPVLKAREPALAPPVAIESNRQGENWSVALLSLLAHPNISSKEHIIRRYDHEVGAATVGKPLVGRAGHSDAAVLRPLSKSWRGVVVAHGINPLYGELDPHAMAMMAVDEALRNLVAVGGSIDRAALVDNFCWGDVDDRDALGALVLTAEGCRDATVAFGVPFITGKDSLRNTSLSNGEERSIPGTLLISVVGVVPDIRRTVTADLKETGSSLYLLGETRDELGGSHYFQVTGARNGEVPRVRTAETPQVMRALTLAIRGGFVRSCHDLSEGGLSVAAAEMSIAGSLGMDLDVERIPVPTQRLEVPLFSESPGRFLVEVHEEKRANFERLFRDLPCMWVGKTTDDQRFVIRNGGDVLIDMPLGHIDDAWRGAEATGHYEGSATEGRATEARVLSHESRNGECGRGSATEGRATELGVAGHESTSGSGVGGRLPKVKTLVLAAAGVNCDRETVEACRLAGAEVELIHLNQLLSGARSLLDFGFLILPGGFSYGDHLGAGSMLATILRYRLLGDLHRFIEEGRPVLGICNGFQTLARLGLLGDVSLTSNLSGKFECRWLQLRVESSPCVFLTDLDDLELPIAHGEGRVVCHGHSHDPLEGRLESRAPLRYIQNPNGSMHDIAGICNENGNVFGLMPHPERYLNAYHHPDWHRRKDLPPLGLRLFENAVSHARRGI